MKSDHHPVDIYKYDVYRGPNMGIYASANDSAVFVPMGFARTKAENLAGYLDAGIIYTSVANTRLLGALMVANNHGLLLPATATEHEYKHLKKTTGLNVGLLDSRYTALGNLICANDKGAIISPEFAREEVRTVEDVLGVESVQKKIAGYHQVGAMAAANMHGGIIHPETEERDIKFFSDVLGVGMEAATVNGGIPFVSSGVLVNNKAVVAGSFTSGPEIMMMTRAFSS